MSDSNVDYWFNREEPIYRQEIDPDIEKSSGVPEKHDVKARNTPFLPLPELGELIHARRSVPTLEDIIQRIVEKFGGSSEFADMFFNTFMDAKKGTMIRSRMLEKVLDLMKVNAQLFPSGDNLEDMSEDELKAAMASVMRSVVEEKQDHEQKRKHRRSVQKLDASAVVIEDEGDVSDAGD
jgi:hypothetical protein